MLRKAKGWLPPILLISPSLLLLAVFVYGFIGLNVQQSMTNAHTAGQVTGRRPTEFVGLDNYIALFTSESFQHSLRNLLLFTLAFLVGTLLIGFTWAWVLEKPMRGECIFRSIFLFPMAVSFVASGVVWKWLLNANQGDAASGLNRLFQMTGLGFLQNPWWTHISLGILAIALPAIWQLSGYVMALFLAGFRGIPEELREAGRIDGASEWQLYRYVIFPQLSPIALSALIIIGHMSLKAFDLIMSISSQSAYSTLVPAIDMYVFKTTYDYANAAAVGAILLVIVAVLVIPYLVLTSRAESKR
ncbi:glucose/mannose transport system permease protein [Kineosphaera limosa]|uniref:Putative ABC transporter permease protein n=1 Tax=Kineosphaera limosa NBRC 100340 TaxID=1184609 RepID=K6WSA8_9MICO|nr:sugar ABC transporter permease [Kineosphaera limosa]NYE01833.1 glucose/mannose transport system permease protein [Kineosphaera limosa]GAB96736.1 putative ABC transporter permease protein [Kineosphaera limosa NBRC 100340]